MVSSMCGSSGAGSPKQLPFHPHQDWVSVQGDVEEALWHLTGLMCSDTVAEGDMSDKTPDLWTAFISREPFSQKGCQCGSGSWGHTRIF